MNSDTTVPNFGVTPARRHDRLMPATDSAAFLARLKLHTRSEHDAIERVLALTSDTLTRAGYGQRMGLFYGFYEPVESALLDVSLTAQRPADAVCRRKTPWLVADLKALGLDALTLARCNELAPLETAADRFGCFYVLEGATLGGQIISRHLRQTLGVTPEEGGRFFHAYGERTSFMWQSFRAALAAFAVTAETQQAVIGSAVSTFRAMRRWCEGGLA